MRFTSILGMIVVTLGIAASNASAQTYSTPVAEEIIKLMSPYRNTFGFQQVKDSPDKFSSDGLKNQCEPLERKEQCDKMTDELTTLFADLWNALKFDPVVSKPTLSTDRGALKELNAGSNSIRYQRSYLRFLQKYKDFVMTVWLAADKAEQDEWKAQDRTPRQTPAPPVRIKG